MNEPKEIFNPRTGQRMRFVVTGEDSAGERLEIDCVSLPGGEREPEHIHPFQESRCEVYRGRLRFRVAGAEQVVGEGEGIVIPPGVPHHFWVEGNEEAHYRQEFRPALKTEAFFDTLFALARAGKLNSRGMPPIMMLGILGQTFWQEIRITTPPEWVQRLLYAVLAPVGRAFGYRLPAQ